MGANIGDQAGEFVIWQVTDAKEMPLRLKKVTNTPCLSLPSLPKTAQPAAAHPGLPSLPCPAPYRPGPGFVYSGSSISCSENRLDSVVGHPVALSAG